MWGLLLSARHVDLCEVVFHVPCVWLVMVAKWLVVFKKKKQKKSLCSNKLIDRAVLQVYWHTLSVSTVNIDVQWASILTLLLCWHLKRLKKPKTKYSVTSIGENLHTHKRPPFLYISDPDFFSLNVKNPSILYLISNNTNSMVVNITFKIYTV